MSPDELIEVLQTGMIFIIFTMSLIALKKPKWVIKEIVKELNDLQLKK